MTLQTRHDTHDTTTPSERPRRNVRMILAIAAVLTLLAIAGGFAIRAATTDPEYRDPYAAQRAAKVVKNTAAARQALDRYNAASDRIDQQGSAKGIDLTSVATGEELTDLQAYADSTAQSGEHTTGSVRAEVVRSEYVTVSPTHYQVEYSVCYDRTGARLLDRAGRAVQPLGPDGTHTSYRPRSLSRVLVDGTTTSQPRVIQTDPYVGTC